MAGYHHYSMSNNAIEAYKQGLLPSSKIKQVPAELIKQFCRYEEWHHSSKFYNVVEFYNPEYVLATFGLLLSNNYEINPQAITALKEYKNTNEKHYDNCYVEWLEWSGSRNYPKATKMIEESCIVSIKKNTATITLSNGKVFKKRLTTKGLIIKPQV